MTAKAGCWLSAFFGNGRYRARHVANLSVMINLAIYIPAGLRPVILVHAGPRPVILVLLASLMRIKFARFSQLIRSSAFFTTVLAIWHVLRTSVTSVHT